MAHCDFDVLNTAPYSIVPGPSRRHVSLLIRYAHSYVGSQTSVICQDTWLPVKGQYTPNLTWYTCQVHVHYGQFQQRLVTASDV